MSSASWIVSDMFSLTIASVLDTTSVTTSSPSILLSISMEALKQALVPGAVPFGNVTMPDTKFMSMKKGSIIMNA